MLVIGGAFLAFALVAIILSQTNPTQQVATKTGEGSPVAGGGGGIAQPQPGLRPSDPSDITGKLSVTPEILAQAGTQGPMRIFIIARPASQGTGGPPMAVSIAQMASGGETIDYAIGPADLMMGTGDFSQPMMITARWDRDGNASTKDPLDAIGAPANNPIKPGTKGVDIVLDAFLGQAGAGQINIDAAQQGQAAPEGQAASAPADGEAPAAAGAPAGDGAGQAADIKGTIKVDPSLAGALPSGGFFFVIARPAGATTGPPIAVAKIPAAAPPVAFRVGPEHVMAGGGFDQPMQLSVRWDQDGNAEVQAGDLSGAPTQNPVSPGANDVEVVLTQKH